MKKITLSQKVLVAVISALLFICGAVTTYFFVLSDRDAGAFNATYTESANAVIIPELWNGDKTSGSFSASNVRLLLQMLSNDSNGTVTTISNNINKVTANSQGIKMLTATNLRGYSAAGNVANKSIVVTLGGFKWIVTCVSKDASGNVVATLWLDDAPSEKSRFGNSGHSGSNSFTEGIPSGMYGSSYIRAVTLNNGGVYANITASGSGNAPTSTLTATSSINHTYGAFTLSSGALYPYVVAPNNIPYQTTSQGKPFESNVINNESLKTDIPVSEYYNGSADYTFQNKSPYYTAWGNDKLWLPSLSETGCASDLTGIWQTSQAERSNSVTYSWTRSCCGNEADSILVLNSSGSGYGLYGVFASFAVRPALHLNLNLMTEGMIGRINLDRQSGSGGTPSVSGWTGDAMPTITIPTRLGYMFGGYYTGTNGIGEQYYSAAGTSTKTFTSSSPTTLYAYWVPNTYTIQYNGNGATGGTTANSAHTYNTAKNLTANGYTKTGYTFSGWATSSTGSVVYTNQQSVTNLTAENGAIITLYAKWAPISYTITYNGNNASGGSTANSSHTYDTPKALTANGYTRTGYIFSGWSLNAGGAAAYTDGQSVTNLANTNGATVTLYAAWTPITYTIAYNGNGATGGSTASSTHTYDVDKYLTENGYNKIGYHFLGWARSANGDLEYSYSEVVKNLTTTNGATVTLYAKWTPNNYTVTFNYNGATGGNSTATKSIIYDSTYGDLPEPSKAGAIFGGWYLESNFVTKITSTTMVTTADDHILYAKWQSLVIVHVSGATTDFEYRVKFDEEDDYAKVTIMPATNYYVSEYSLDNVTFYQAKYYLQSLGYLDYGYASCVIDKNSNKVTFSFDYTNLNYIKQHPINIYVNFASGTNSSLQEGGNQIVDGVNVTATYGGMVSMIGDDFENLADTDTVTFVANVCVDGYKFSHWENSEGDNLGTEDSIRLAKSVVMDNIIKAVFVPADNSLVNGDKNNQ